MAVPRAFPAATSIDKRGFFRLLGAAAIAGIMPGVAGSAAASDCSADSPGAGTSRRNAALRARFTAARAQREAFACATATNGDEEGLPRFINSYSKGLPHDELGEVQDDAFRALRAAVTGTSREALAAVPAGTTPPARQILAWAGHGFSLAGPDPQGVPLPLPPRFDSAEAAAEMVELYWAALTRDVPFAAYDSDPMIAAACTELSALPGYRGPRIDGRVTPRTIFRGAAPGELDGPYLSQFLVRPIPHGPYEHEQRLRPFLPGVDYQVGYADWLLAQRGGGLGPTAAQASTVHQRNGRDLAAYLLTDYAGQPALEAALILNRIGAPPNPSLPPFGANDVPPIGGFNQFVQLVGLVTAPALAACFYQKWQVHRRARPDAVGGRVQNHMLGRASYPLQRGLLDSQALAATFSRNGTYLLPMAYRVGPPTHPAFPAGHAVSVAAGVTLLKALYRGDFVLTGNKVPAPDGLSLLDHAGPLTLEGELNKLAANVALGRDAAGVHFRSDSVAGMLLGEAVALQALGELRRTLAFTTSGIRLRTFAGETVSV